MRLETLDDVAAVTPDPAAREALKDAADALRTIAKLAGRVVARTHRSGDADRLLDPARNIPAVVVSDDELGKLNDYLLQMIERGIVPESPERAELVRLYRYIMDGEPSAADQCAVLYEALGRVGLQVP